MAIAILPEILAVGSGAIIGLVLGLVGGVGSIRYEVSARPDEGKVRVRNGPTLAADVIR